MALWKLPTNTKRNIESLVNRGLENFELRVL